MTWLPVIVSSFIMSFSYTFVISHLSDDEKADKVNEFETFLVLACFFCLSTELVSPFIRPFIIIMVIFIIEFCFYNMSAKKSILSAFFVQFIGIIGEIFFSCIFYLLEQGLSIVSFVNTVYGNLICNFFIAIMVMILSQTKIMKKLYLKINSFMISLNIIKTITSITITFFVIILLFYVVYYKYSTNQLALYFVVVLMFVFYSVILFMILYYYYEYNKIKNKYVLSLDNLKEYEDLINRYRVINHENRNQLLVVRNMGNYKKAKEYIDELIENKDKDVKNISYRVKRIPSNYLRAVIYTKMMKMEKENIKCELIIDRNINSEHFLNIDDKTLLDICNIVNVFLDNAIEAVILTVQKIVSIEMTEEDTDIVIYISNKFSGVVKLNQITNIRYTTKGEGHGYGLALVKEIVNNNSALSNKQKVNNNAFSQILKIKM